MKDLAWFSAAHERRRAIWPMGSGDVPGEEIVAEVQCRGFRHSLAELAVTVCAQATPTSRPHLVFVAEVRDCASCPFCLRLAAAMPCSMSSRRRCHRGQSGQEWRSPAPWMQLLKLTATSQGCRYDVLRGGRKHSTKCGRAVLHGCQRGLVRLLAMFQRRDPTLSLLAWIEHVVQCGRELQDRGRRCPAVL